jgi:hypothetical protein
MSKWIALYRKRYAVVQVGLVVVFLGFLSHNPFAAEEA